MGWTEGFASAADDWRLHDEIARKIRTARSTTPSAPTAALPLIDSRSPSEGMNDACEPYHALYAAVNLFGCFPAPNGARANPPRTCDAGDQAAASASAAARPASAMSASVCASETKAASNWEGARNTPRSSIAWK